MKILVGSKNPGKIEGVKKAFELFFEGVEVCGFDADSEVASQPINEDTMKGAKNRVKNLKQYAKNQALDAEYYVAVESKTQVDEEGNLLSSFVPLLAESFQRGNSYS